MEIEAAGPFPILNRRGKERLNVQLFASYLEVVDGNGNRGEIPLDGIQSMHLNHAMSTEYGGYHHVCELRDKQGKSWRFRADEGMPMEQKGYHDLVQALHLHFLAQPAPPAFLTGFGKAWMYWVLVFTLGACFALLEVAVAVGTSNKGNYLLGGLFLVLIPFMAYHSIRFIAAMAKPKKYDPHAIPPHLLPPLQPLS